MSEVVPTSGGGPSTPASKVLGEMELKQDIGFHEPLFKKVHLLFYANGEIRWTKIEIEEGLG